MTLVISGGVITTPGSVVTLVRLIVSVSLASRVMLSSPIGKSTHFKNSAGAKVNSWFNCPSPGCRAGEESSNANKQTLHVWDYCINTVMVLHISHPPSHLRWSSLWCSGQLSPPSAHTQHPSPHPLESCTWALQSWMSHLKCNAGMCVTGACK